MADPVARVLDEAASGFLDTRSLVAVFDALEKAGGQVRVNGGAVRNALMGEPVSDVDLSTDLRPNDVIEAAESAGLKAVPTGIDHGTITLVSGGDAYEVTTLRKDIKTDGRHAVVEFGTDWQADAMRRDFTVNGLYLGRDRTLFDYVGGLEDVHRRNIRFIGDAGERITEDYLRILRLFRFFAWYGPERVGRPDADALRAVARHKEGLSHLSAERIWKELRKLLAAPDPGKALLWMRTTGVLSIVLPESEKWGIDAMPGLLEAENNQQWTPDALLRLAAIIPLRAEAVSGLADRLKFSNADRKALLNMAETPAPSTDTSDENWRSILFYSDREALIRRLKLAVASASARGDDDAAAFFLTRCKAAEEFVKPEFPLSGQDLLAVGVSRGPRMGEVLKGLEEKWIASGFQMSAQDLLDTV
jgi:tRNA nucleotidyltransferase/poly(A) polymerase